MCDYSLANLPSRLAEKGETLVVHRFPTGTKGLASPADLNGAEEPRAALSRWLGLDKMPCAVCIPPGACLLLRDIPERLQQRLAVGVEEEVTFTQLSAEPYQYRDAVQFVNGSQALLQDLARGQRVNVLCLCSDEEALELELRHRWDRD
jgi:hypothetical protein